MADDQNDAVRPVSAGRHHRRAGRGTRDGRRHRGHLLRRIPAAVWLVLALVVCLFLPTSLTIESPGPTLNVLGRIDSTITGNLSEKEAKKLAGTPVLALTGVTRHQDSGRLLMTTVNANGIPGQPALVIEALWGWASPDAAVMPREAYFDVNQTNEEYEQEETRQMSGAQTSAQAQAKAFLTARGYDVSKMKVSATAGDVGGPSAGLMMTLGLIDLVTPASETGGKTIAGTGTIEKGGKVGAIGGIRFKMIGARRAGATWFLAPASNCDEVVGNIPSGMRVVKVSTLSGAYSALVRIGKGQTSSLPTCTVPSAKSGSSD